nr:hypothetical protein [Nonlabens ulvanivorans]
MPLPTIEKMIYYTFHIDDSGAIEDIDYKKVNGQTIPICKIYDDNDFNKLNDILHSLDDYILNEKALNIFKESKTLKYDLTKAVVLRKEKLFGFIKKYKSYEYYHLNILKNHESECYDWIDFEKSEISAINNKNEKIIKILSHQHKLELIAENKSDSNQSFSFEVKKIVFGENFDFEIDFFKIPLYSSGEYVSERFKSRMEKAEIKDIGFANRIEQLNKVWQPMFPIIEFANKNGR